MNIEERVKEILSELSSESEFFDDANLQSDLALDSLAMVTLLLEIEDTFEIQLDESDMNPFELETVKNVVDLVRKYTGEKNE